MNIKPETEIIPEEEVNLYDYWKILVKRKKIFLGIFLVPLVLVTIISLGLPSYYIGESEITNTLIPAPNIVNLIGNIDDAKKNRIFTNDAGAIKSVLISLSKKAPDKVTIIIDAKTVDIIPQASKIVFDYINNLPGIKDEFARIQAEIDLKIAEINFKIENLIEIRKANLVFLNDISDMIKKGKIIIVNINPADLVKRDGDLLLEIINFQNAKKEMIRKKELNVKVSAGILGIPTITKQPSNAQIEKIIMVIFILSLLISIFIVFFLEYIERMEARKKNI
jgi:hypothetical protein